MARDLASATQTGDHITAQLDKVIEKYLERKRSHSKLKSMIPNSSLGMRVGSGQKRNFIRTENASNSTSHRGVAAIRNSLSVTGGLRQIIHVEECSAPFD